MTEDTARSIRNDWLKKKNLIMTILSILRSGFFVFFRGCGRDVCELGVVGGQQVGERSTHLQQDRVLVLTM